MKNLELVSWDQMTPARKQCNKYDETFKEKYNFIHF